MTDITVAPYPILTVAAPLQEYLQQVEVLLDVQEAGGGIGLVQALQQLIRAGGKRLRPRIVLLTGRLLGADPNRLAYLAAAIEMLHTATLIHDDLIDDSILRRGLETLNMRWSPAAAVLAGDFAFTRAAELVASADSTAVMRFFAESMTVMVAGEMRQLLREGGIASREEYYCWISAKTASLFELAAGAAALLSRASAESVAAARRFGHEVGMAFQIVDDVLDFSGDPVALGKPVGSDLRQGLVTLPALFYLESQPDDITLQALIAHKKTDEASLKHLLESIHQSGAIQAALAEAYAFLQRGLDALEYLPASPEREALAEIAQSVATRRC